MLRFCSVYLDAPAHQNRDFGGNALNMLKPILPHRLVAAMVFVSPDPILAAFFCPFCARLLYVLQTILVILPSICECMCMHTDQQAEGESYLFSDLKSDSRARRYECWKTEALSGFFSLQHEQCENESESAYKYPRCPFLVLTTCSPFLGMTTLNTSVRLKSQNSTFPAWIYQNRCFGITNLRTSFSAILF